MKLIKQDNQQVILSDVKIAKNPFSRMKGLLFTKEILPGKGLCLKPCNGVHSIGMRYAIDVIYLNKAGAIQKIIHDFKPGKLGPVNFKTHQIVEMKAGTLKPLDLTAGEVLTFQ